MPKLNPYLTFNGNCEEAFTFYKSIFGGEFTSLSRFSEMPVTEGIEVRPRDANLIMHISLPISEGLVLMGSDTSETFGLVKTGTNFSISINADSKQEADRIFQALSSDGEIKMPMGDAFWGSYFGMLTDQFGIQWMVSFGER